MSRKSRLTVYREKLAKASDSPQDIFDKLAPSDDLIDSVIAAESGDKSAISELSLLLFSVYSKENEPNDSAVYFMNKGIESGDVRSAVNLITYCSIKSDALEHVDRAIDMIRASNALISPDILKDVLLKRIICDAEAGEPYSTLTERLKSIKHDGEPYAMVYLCFKAMLKGETSLEELIDLCNEAYLPSMQRSWSSEVAPDNYIATAEEKRAFMKAIGVTNLDIWQDFWLKCIFEYCITYLDENLTDFAEDIARVLERRRFSRRAKLHALAFIKYIYESHPEGSEKRAFLLDWYERTVKDCVLDGNFKGIRDKEEVFRLMREAAYTSEYQERLEARGNVVGGSKIVHEKNRYKLECVLTGHAKRGNRHMWESMLSIECNGGEPPVFSGITISERRNVIGRGGATLEQEKRRSQIICSGEILMGGKASPFMLDLILDISYVSTTKCEVVEIKPKKTRILDSHAIMDCYIYIS